MPNPLDTITQANLDDLADLANDKIVPQSYAVSDPDVGGVVDSTTFAFPDIATDTQRTSALDEWNRIYCSLYDVAQLNNPPTDPPNEYAFDTGADDLTDMDRMFTVLEPWWDQDDTDIRNTVVSNGPHLWRYLTRQVSKTGTTHKRVRAFRSAKFIFSRKDCPEFDLRPGFLFGPIDDPYITLGDNLEHHSTSGGGFAGPATVSFGYDISGGVFFGNIFFEFIHADGSLAPDPVDVDAGFDGWGSGGGNTWERDAGTLRVYLAFNGIATKIDNSSSGALSGTLNFRAYVNDSGWKWSRTVITGLIQTGVAQNSANDSIAPDFNYPNPSNIIHPRNSSMRTKFHFYDDAHFRDYASNADDIVDYDGFVLALQARASAAAIAVYYACDAGIQTLIDAYTSGDPLSVTLYNGIITALNVMVDGGNLYDTGDWAGVTLREATQWLIDVDPDGQLLQALNRLLLEDAFPLYLRRVPKEDFEVADEIAQITVPDMTFAHVSEDDAFFGGLEHGILCTVHSGTTGNEDTEPNGLVIGCYICKAWPQPAIHTFLDADLPHYYEDTDTDTRSALWTGSVVNGASGAIGTVNTTAENLLSVWPVIKSSNFGATGAGKGYAKMQHRTPYWTNDSHHVWGVSFSSASVEPGMDTGNMTQFIQDPDGDPLLERARYEFSGGNRNATVYVGADIVDPDNPATYLFSRSDGRFTFPDDFITEGLTPSDYYDTNIFYIYKNTSGSPLTIFGEVSRFYLRGNEDTGEPPRPEPLMFQRYSRTSDDFYNMHLELSDNNPASEDSYRFTAFDVTTGWGATQGRAMPIPERGYCVHGLIIRHKPVSNSAGVLQNEVRSSTVKIGIMAGTGVVAGAETGVYPGEFMEFAEYTLTSQSEKLVSVFWPVLEGCPLAYQSVSGEHVITALVCFQPAVNVNFRARYKDGFVQQGDYSGRPYFMGHSLFLHDKNQSLSVYDYGLVTPPISKLVYDDLYRIIELQPDI